MSTYESSELLGEWAAKLAIFLPSARKDEHLQVLRCSLPNQVVKVSNGPLLEVRIREKFNSVCLHERYVGIELRIDRPLPDL